MNDILSGRHVVLGVSGSIAAYKALTIAARLTEAGALVDVVMTRSATELVRPLAFQALTHRPVVTSLFEPTGEAGLDHITLARRAELIIVAPATADVIARLALGRADDALTTTALATTAPLIFAPAMEPNMWAHPATQGNAETLRARGAGQVGPAPGRMASGEVGVGRMSEPEEVVERARRLLSPAGDLAGRRIVVSAGPTHEPLDPVRYLGNRSTGRMGYAVARAARDRGAEVILVTGPSALTPPGGVAVIQVQTARDMRDAVLDHATDADALVMAAAVADYRPAAESELKLKKTGGAMELELVPNPDVLAELDTALGEGAKRPVRVGFAAETDNLVANALGKLERKGLDMVVANPVPASFEGAESTATLVTSGGAEQLPPLPKEQLANIILDRVRDRLGG